MASQFHQDDTPILANQGSPFHQSLVNGGCTTEACVGTAEEWIEVSFDGEYTFEHLPYNVLYLIALIIFARTVTLYALMKLNYLSK